MKYIKFSEVIIKRLKTRIFIVSNKVSGDDIGVVKWYPAWRKYCFISNCYIVLDSVCLIDISNFLIKLMEERKKRSKH